MAREAAARRPALRDPQRQAVRSPGRQDPRVALPLDSVEAGLGYPLWDPVFALVDGPYHGKGGRRVDQLGMACALRTCTVLRLCHRH
eukprot:6361451-Heterocapsa_arctica.AAC.1